MNDPRITAYALNELPGVEREKFEADLAADAQVQSDLQKANDVVGALGQVLTEPAEGLEPGARQRLLRDIAANQEAFRARRKIVRWAVPVSLAAASSIAILLAVGGWAERARSGPRTISLSDSAKASYEMRLQGEASPTPPAVRERFLLWDERLERLGSSSQEAP